MCFVSFADGHTPPLCGQRLCDAKVEDIITGCLFFGLKSLTASVQSVAFAHGQIKDVSSMRLGHFLLALQRICKTGIFPSP